MSWIVAKYLITAALVVLISEAAKHSGKFGALITALPMVAIMTLIWLYVEHEPAAKIATYARYTFWYVVPTLPMFLVFPVLQSRLGFWFGLLAAALLTLICFFAFALLMRRFGVDLL